MATEAWDMRVSGSKQGPPSRRELQSTSEQAKSILDWRIVSLAEGFATHHIPCILKHIDLNNHIWHFKLLFAQEKCSNFFYMKL